VSVTLSTTSTTLQSGTLVISYATESSLQVPLTGAYGAIKLFDETNVTTSVSTASFSNMYTIASAGLNLSCPASPTATVSNTPDGNGYVLVDNYLALAISGTPVNSGNDPAGNICRGGPADSFDGNSFNDCFSTNYQVPAGTNFGLNGQNPDTFTNPGNSVLSIVSPNLNNAGGVPPIDVSSFFSMDETPPYPVQASFAALDSGYVYDNSTLFLVTNCSLAGITPGGTVAGNPITPTNPSSQTQTITFDAGPGQNISYETSVANAVQQGTVTIPTGTVPVITDIGVPQPLFYQLVAGTSAAPAVCLRLTGELDPFGQTLCKGYLVQCQFTDPTTGITTTTGDNCAPTPSTLRNLFDLVQFSSPDGPLNGTNYLYNSSPNACSNVVSGGSCAAGTGPGLLMGSDNWLCASGLTSPCTPLEPNTSTPTTPATYSATNCQLTGSLAGDLCPLDTLTQFLGAADPLPAGTTNGKNSLFIPVVNMPLPTAQATVAVQNASGWINTSTINATFVANAATYPSAGNIPAANGVSFAPAYSLTFGLSPWPTLPDTTFPVATDITNYNPTGTKPGLQTPPCTLGAASGNTPSSFTSNGSFGSLSDGIYNLHYFTTDCAYTEGLVFNPQRTQLTDPTANWASFPFVTIGVDTTAPTFSCSTSPSTSIWYNSNQTVQCLVTDQNYSPGVSGSGFLPLLPNSIQGSQTETVAVSTSVAPGGVNQAAPTNTLSACDLAGNCVPVSAGPFMIDRQPPTIAGPTFVPAASGNKYLVGQGIVTINYSCSDGIGSGVAFCTGQGLPPGTITGCTTTASGQSCSSSFTASATTVGSYLFNVSAQDNAGNSASLPSPVSFSVAYAPASVLFGPIPALAIPGTSLAYYVGAADVNPAKNPVSVYGANIAVQLQIPNGTLKTGGSVSAIFADVTCTSFPCSDTPPAGSSCSVSTSTGASTTTVTINCNVGTLPDLFTTKSGVVVKIVLPISANAPVGKYITTSGAITAASPISGTTSFSSSILIL
jgi:hypothetical protein